jgi:hypothetical protein
MDDPVNDQDIGPPGEAIKPAVEWINLPKVEDFREEKDKDSQNPMKRKGLFHQSPI